MYIDKLIFFSCAAFCPMQQHSLQHSMQHFVPNVACNIHHSFHKQHTNEWSTLSFICRTIETSLKFPQHSNFANKIDTVVNK